MAKHVLVKMVRINVIGHAHIDICTVLQEASFEPLLHQNSSGMQQQITNSCSSIVLAKAELFTPILSREVPRSLFSLHSREKVGLLTITQNLPFLNLAEQETRHLLTGLRQVKSQLYNSDEKVLTCHTVTNQIS